MKDLPKVFANKIDRNINKNQDLYYGNNQKSFIKENINVDKKIKQIFNDIHYVYKSNVEITTSEGVIEKTIIGMTKDSLITINGELIKINSILDIEKK